MKYHLAAITQDQGSAEQLGESRELMCWREGELVGWEIRDTRGGSKEGRGKTRNEGWQFRYKWITLG